MSGTVTHRTARSPRLRKLSVAIVVDEKTPRSPQEVAGLRELAKRAVGFDEDRGDMLELSSVAFLRVPEEVEPAITPSSVVSSIPDWVFIAGGILVAIIVLLLIMLVVGRGRARAATAAALDTLPSATSSFATARVENQAALAAGPLASRRHFGRQRRYGDDRPVRDLFGHRQRRITSARRGRDLHDFRH